MGEAKRERKGREGRHSTTTIFEECTLGREIILVRGLVKIVFAVAYVNLPAPFSQPHRIIISQPSTCVSGNAPNLRINQNLGNIAQM